MSDRNKKQQNNDELKKVHSLIGDADGKDFSLDDILAEYGSGKGDGHGAVPLPTRPGQEESGVDDDLPWPAARPHPHYTDNVVAFPGGENLDEDEEDSEEDEEPAEEGAEEDVPEEEEPGYPEEDEDNEAPEEDGEPDNVLQFPEEESALSAILKDLGDKADSYADQMFEEDEQTDPDEVRRLEKLIPGTDLEDEEPKQKQKKHKKTGGEPKEPRAPRKPLPIHKIHFHKK